MEVKNNTPVAAARNGWAEDESFEWGNTPLLARFTSWHAGWIVTELPRDSVSGLGLPAFFHSLAWDTAQKDLLLTLVPESLVPMTSTHCVLITGVIGLHVCPSSMRPLGRLISFETEKGKASIIRLELHLSRRRAYQRYHESCFNRAFVHDL